MHRIVQAIPEGPMELRLVFEDGKEITYDFSALSRQGGVFTALNDPLFFSQVQVVRKGRALEWPGELDLCADALWLGDVSTELTPQKT